MTTGLLTNYLVVAALLFALGVAGFLARRNLIVMFISAELMLQGVSLNLVAFNQYHRAAGTAARDDGQVFTLMILTVAAAEAAIALSLIVTMFRRRGTLDVSVWQSLREPGQPTMIESPLTEPLAEPEPQWPKLPVAGLEPQRAERSSVAPGGPS